MFEIAAGFVGFAAGIIISLIIAALYIGEVREQNGQLNAALASEREHKNEEINRIQVEIGKKYETMYENWKLTDGEEIVKQRVKMSRAITRGKGMENVAAFLPEFKYLPSDARFLGSPVDMLVFNNMSSVRDGRGGEIEIVFLDIKTGDSNLTPVQRKIKEAVVLRRVKWETLRI